MINGKSIGISMIMSEMWCVNQQKLYEYVMNSLLPRLTWGGQLFCSKRYTRFPILIYCNITRVLSHPEKGCANRQNLTDKYNIVVTFVQKIY